MKVTVWEFDGLAGPGTTTWADAVKIMLDKVGVDATGVKAYRDDPLTAGGDAHILCGGATSVGESSGSRFAWKCAQRLVDQALREGTPVLGVCLGSQILAASINSGVCSGDDPDGTEVGVVEIIEHTNQIQWQVAAFHRHTIQPEFAQINDVEVLASNGATMLQAWKWHSVYGVSFHPELNASRCAAAVEANPHWVKDAPLRAAEIRNGVEVSSGVVHRWLYEPLGIV